MAADVSSPGEYYGIGSDESLLVPLWVSMGVCIRDFSRFLFCALLPLSLSPLPSLSPSLPPSFFFFSFSLSFFHLFLFSWTVTWTQVRSRFNTEPPELLPVFTPAAPEPLGRTRALSRCALLTHSGDGSGLDCTPMCQGAGVELSNV